MKQKNHKLEKKLKDLTAKLEQEKARYALISPSKSSASWSEHGDDEASIDDSTLDDNSTIGTMTKEDTTEQGNNQDVDLASIDQYYTHGPNRQSAHFEIESIRSAIQNISADSSTVANMQEEIQRLHSMESELVSSKVTSYQVFLLVFVLLINQCFCRSNWRCYKNKMRNFKMKTFLFPKLKILWVKRNNTKLKPCKH